MDPETWKRWNFREWCALDPEDKRKINYLVKDASGKEPDIKFSSTDTVDWIIFELIRTATIEKMELIENEWHATLTY